jgi:hypothetical protein
MDSRQRRQQLKKEQHRRDREIARRKAMARDPSRLGIRGLKDLAARSAFGPAWVSSALFDDDRIPPLVTVVIARHCGRDLLAHILLVDRTCLGVKSAFVMRPMTSDELDHWVATVSDQGDPLQPCDPLLAQSVIFHAIDYAGALGFAPHSDFEQSLVGPRPAELLDTPLAHSSRPLYCSGPDDDVPRILQRLTEAVGEGNYEVLVADEQLSLDDIEDDDSLI